MKAINPYFNFPGTAEEAFTLYRSVFGGEFAMLMRFRDMPDGACASLPEADKGKVMHIALPLPNGTVLMATDALASVGQTYAPGNNVSISIACESEAEVTRLYNALSAGGKPGMPPAKMFWGAFFGTCTDKFAIQWMFNFEYPKG